jgi:hypothetical protein
MPFDAARYPGAVTFGWLIEKGMHAGLHRYPCGSACDRVAKPATVRGRHTDAGGRWQVQMHPLWIHHDRGAAGVAETRVTAAIGLPVFGASCSLHTCWGVNHETQRFVLSQMKSGPSPNAVHLKFSSRFKQ